MRARLLRGMCSTYPTPFLPVATRYPLFYMQAELYIKVGGQEFLVASLAQNHPHVTLDIHLSILDKAQLLVKDSGTIHVVGLYENDVDADEDIEGDDS